MTETYRDGAERSGAELEFDELWEPVLETHSRYAEHTGINNVIWQLNRDQSTPGIVFSTEIEAGLGEATDQEVFDRYVDLDIVTANVARYVREKSIIKDLEAAIASVNDYLGFDPSKKDALARGYTGTGPILYLHGIPGSALHGYNPKRSVRLFGFNTMGTAAIVKRFGDRQERLEEFDLLNFCYAFNTSLKPTLNPGDYDVVPEAETIDSGEFS